MYAAPGTAAYAAHGTEQTTMQAHTHTERLTDREKNRPAHTRILMLKKRVMVVNFWPGYEVFSPPRQQLS